MAPLNIDKQSPNNSSVLLKDDEEQENEKAPLKRDDEEDEESETDVVVPPDGGWGWVVVFASFMCNLVVDGIIFSFGNFLEPITTEFQVDKFNIALVGSLMSGFYLIAGPFVSALANRYGFRLVAVTGSIIASIGIALSYYATSVLYLCITFGVLGGIGFGFIYAPSVIIVGYYFEKWRALATGIAVCGSGIGTFLMSPLTKTMIQQLGWRTSFLCLGAIVLASMVFGLLFRPVKPIKVKKDVALAELKMDPEKLPPLAKLKMEAALEALNGTDPGSLNRVFGANNGLYHTIHVPQKAFEMSCYEKRLSIPLFGNEAKTKNPESKEQLLNKLVSNNEKRRKSGADLEITRPMYRDDIFFNASLTRLPQYTSRSSIAYNIAVTKPATIDEIEEEKQKTFKICPLAVKRALSSMMDFTLLKSPTFLLLAIGGFFTMMGFYIPFMYLVDRAKEAKMEEEYWGFLIAAIGISNTIGRVLCGVLTSFPGVNALFVTNAALSIGGIATIFSGYFMTPECQFIYTAIFGLAISTFASLRSIVVVDLLGLERLTNAFGLLLLFQGVAAIVGSPLAGIFDKAVGNFNASFYFSGVLLLASAVMCYPLNYINRIEKAKKNERRSVPI